ncbi:TlpA family protein disulfide reductase [Kaarinaea lacus]
MACSSHAKPITETKIISDDVEVVVFKHPAEGQQLLLWIAPSFGFRQGHSDMSQLLSKHGFEVWQADINEALFLPHNSTVMRELNPKYVSDLIKIAHTETGKQVVLISGSYGAIPALRGAREWVLTKPDNRYLLGVVLFSPNVYQSIPPLGTEPEFLPIAYATNFPVVIFQGEMNSNRWQVEKLAAALRSGGSFVHIEMMKNVVGLFYGEERAPHIEKYFHNFASNMKNHIEWFVKNPYSLEATKIEMTKPSSSGTGLDSGLKPFKGNPKPKSITLSDIDGKPYNIVDYKGRVTVVNFWATWCTPCIKEIPSLNNLRQSMRGKSFELISINYAEKVETIKEFMKMVDVEFPVLLDEQGLESANWKVIAFPSTFVIGRDGLIHYGVNAGIEWDTPEVLNAINQLLQD